MTYHAMFSLYIMTGLLALVISVSLFCKSIAEAKEWKRKFGESYRRNHGTEPEVTGNRVVSKQDLLSGMHMVSAERNSTTGRKVEKDE